MGIELDSKRGVNVSYGPRSTSGKFGARSVDEIYLWAMWDFTYDNLPTYGTSKMIYRIPANSTIVDAKFIVDTAFTSTSTTTDLTMGLYTSAGAAIAADGLVSATDASQTTIAVADSIITGTGSLIGKTIGANAGELVVAGSAADLLTGAGRLIVRYVLNS